MSMKGLEGLKVIELAGYVAAPACPRILGEMGAEIIKIEPFTGDEQRTQGASHGMLKTDVEDPSFDMSSINKNWLAVNLKTDEGREFAYKLIETADIFITSFRDKALERLGMDYETIHKKFPHIVWGQMRGYGERGPEKDSKGFDATSYSARGGLITAFPQKGESPVNVVSAFGDFNAAIALAAGVLAALVRKDRTGEGDKVVVNLYHTAVWAMQIAVVSRQFGREYPRSRKEVPCPSNNCYQTKDGVWFMICYGNYNKYFKDMCHAFGLEQLIGNKELDTLEALGKNGKNVDVIRYFEEAFAKKNWNEWEVIFKKWDMPYQKCFTIDDIISDEEAYDNDILRHINYDAFGDRVIPTSPIRFGSIGDPELWLNKPVGYDTIEYMKKYGYSEEQIDKLIADGVIKAYKGKKLNFNKVKKGPGL